MAHDDYDDDYDEPDWLATKLGWQEAKQRIVVGATYRHRGGDRDVVVARFDRPTGQVWWQAASGPGPADSHRVMDCVDFLRVYERKGRNPAAGRGR